MFVGVGIPVTRAKEGRGSEQGVKGREGDEGGERREGLTTKST